MKSSNIIQWNQEDKKPIYTCKNPKCKNYGKEWENKECALLKLEKNYKLIKTYYKPKCPKCGKEGEKRE